MQHNTFLSSSKKRKETMSSSGMKARFSITRLSRRKKNRQQEQRSSASSSLSSTGDNNKKKIREMRDAAPTKGDFDNGPSSIGTASWSTDWASKSGSSSDEEGSTSSQAESVGSFGMESACSIAATEAQQEETTSRTEKPQAGSSTLKLESLIGEKLHEEDFHMAQESLHHHQSTARPIRWCSVPARELLVRSLDYRQTKRKVPSASELYECIKVDVVQADCRLDNMASRVELPATAADSASSVNKTWHAPNLLVVTNSIPLDPKGAKDDGLSLTISMYLVMTPKTRQVLQRITAANYNAATDPHRSVHDNAVKLWNEWCRRSPTDPRFQARFKLIPNIANLQDLGLPSWISRWNNKPGLIKRSGQTGFLHAHPDQDCLEMEVSFHHFPWAARQAMHYVLENYLHKMQTSIGFVIEGRAEDELPECLIGVSQLVFSKPQDAVPANDFFAKKQQEPTRSRRPRVRSLHSGSFDDA